MKVCRLASRKNFVSKCGNVEFNTHIYMKLMNEENEWDHSISTTIKEGPADCIRMDEVAAALQKAKVCQG